ncbi:serine hydrolase domain-containing protein [Leptolyngbya iicbica]|uniref:Class C beta-lactamase-related serine hydrolase n=2 Tax=Cyanophyceae TaxID=3028117 RepID=A0A4Q7E4I4_9CYAN|nr:serine hydrolase [Leptolyngbya sp. LK]RZM76693.1 class C beta-lactamase-related serine hydrolase [Leptolyngbya sp. LK]
MALPQRHRYRLLLLTAIALAVTLVLPDWRFVSRAMTYPEQPIMAVDWYQPQAAVPGGDDEPLPVAAQPPPPEFAAALQSVADYAAERNSTGLLVMHQGEIVLEQYWQGYDQSSKFNAMSMTKSIVGLLIGQAIAEGAIASVEEPVANYLPEWQRGDRAQITLQDLLYMQSGLRNERSTTSPTSDLVHLYIGSDVEQTALSIPRVRPPGEVFDYNNVNSQILAIVLERATGIAYPEYLATRLWQAIGANPASVWLDRPDGSAKTFCCLFATLRDWARIGQLFLNQGQWKRQTVISPDWLAAMLTPSPIESTFGKHIWVQARTPDHPNVETTATVPYLDPRGFHLDGRGIQRVFVLPTYELVIVRMGEQPDNWDDAVIPNTLIRALSRRTEQP